MVSIRVDSGGLDGCFNLECPKCSTPLVLHQPDIDSPDRMLGICYRCRAWYLLDGLAEVMTELPVLRELKGWINVGDTHS